MARDTSFFTTIKEEIDLEDYLSEHLGVELVPDGPGRMAGLCPFHEEDSPSFKVMDSEDGNWKRWWCFGACQEGGTVIDAAMKAENFGIAHEAAQYLNDLYALELDFNSEAYKNFAKTVAETAGDIQRTKEEMGSDSRVAKAAERYLHNRGLDDEAIEHFQLGVDTKDSSAGRLSIPLIDKANHPVSIANRALFDSFKCQKCGHEVTTKELVKQRHQVLKAKEKGEGDGNWKFCPHCHAPNTESKISWLIGQHPKYKFIRDFDKANFLYNEHSSRQILNKDDTIIGLFLAEGYGEVWAGWMGGNQAFCSYNGAELSDWQAHEAAELVKPVGKPIILVPDFDATGLRNVDKNIRKLRTASETTEIQIVHSVDKLTYKNVSGDEIPCKDLGDVLQHFGPEKVAEVLEHNRWAATEWQIRAIIEKLNPKTGEHFHSDQRQMQLVAEVLSHERSKASLDHLVDYLAAAWHSPVESIRDWFYSNLSEDNATSYQYLFTDVKKARVEARDFLRDTNIIPLGFKDLDDCMPGGGARPGQLMMFLGKEVSVETNVLTSTGWKRMGDIEVGDEVIDPDGGYGHVTGVFPQGVKELFTMTFSDGASVKCGHEHLWLVSNSNRHEWIMSTDQILESGKLERNQQSDWLYIPVTKAVEFKNPADLPIDPYLLGVLLGDGHLGRSVTLTAADLNIVETVKKKLPEGLSLKQGGPGSKPYDYRISGAGGSGSNELLTHLRALALHGKRSWDKFIPEIYLHGSVNDRLELLRGLMDTDGSAVYQVKKNGTAPRMKNDSSTCGVEYCSVSKELADGVVYLVRSLGGTASIGKGTSQPFYRDSQGKKIYGRDRYRVRVSMPPELNPFRSPVKADKWRRKHHPRRRIVSITPSGEKEAQCITVDTQRNLYIIDDFVCTHNSGTGKSLSVDADILTPRGWKRMGDMAVGDEVVDPGTGTGVAVTGVYPQGERDMYRVHFSDGSSVEADREHLWRISRDGASWEVVALADILEAADLASTDYQIPITAPVDFVKQEKQLNGSYEAGRLLSADGTDDKFIPHTYQFASLQVRTSLLQGMLDESGYLDPSDPTVIKYPVADVKMRKDITDLVRSFGGVATVSSAVNAAAVSETIDIILPDTVKPFREADIAYRAGKPSRRMTKIEYVGKKEAQCISVNSQDSLYITDDFIVTHNTMLASQLLANMADHGIRSIFFSLEQAAKSLYTRLVCQALDIDGDEAEELIRSDSPEAEEALKPVAETYGNMLIIDNVPTQTQEALEMTPSRIQAIIQEANLTYFEGEPAQVVVIDHLGILNVDEDAPQDVKRSDLMAPGHIMQRLFAICKSANVLLMVLQQLPKEVPKGKPFSYDEGRGGSKQTDFCDYILQIWRPEMADDIDDEERTKVAGQYKLALGKNRYGKSMVAHLVFDSSSLRIMPAFRITQPRYENDGAVIDLEEGEEAAMAAEMAAFEEAGEATDKAVGEAVGASAERLEELARETDDMPADTQVLLDSIGAHIEEDAGGDPALQAWFDGDNSEK